MLGRMLVFRGIAATHVSAGQTKPEVDPGVAHFETLFAAVGMRLHVMDLVEVSAFSHTLRVP